MFGNGCGLGGNSGLWIIIVIILICCCNDGGQRTRTERLLLRLICERPKGLYIAALRATAAQKHTPPQKLLHHPPCRSCTERRASIHKRGLSVRNAGRRAWAVSARNP